MPPVKVARKRTRAVSVLAAYTLSGGLSSVAFGSLLGVIGRILLPDALGAAAMALTMLVASAAALRGLVSFPIPQFGRQTNVMWRHTFGPSMAAVLWGMDLGLVITTRLTFSGAWSVLLLAVASRHASVGAALLLVYWLGRAAQVWVAAVLVRDANDAPKFLQHIFEQTSLLQRVHVVGLIWAIALLGFLMHEGNHL